jgi:hypothetical protein
LSLFWWFSNTDANLPARQVVAAKSQCSLEPVQCREFHITKSLGLAIQLVFHNADIGNLTVFKEVTHIALKSVK